MGYHGIHHIRRCIPTDRVNRFLSAVTRWASRRVDVHALALVGSRVRGTATWISDVDLVIITDTPENYIREIQWAMEFGTVEKHNLEYYGLLTSLRIFYADGLEVEFGITDLSWAAEPLDEGTRQTIADGMKVLFEHGELLSHHLPA